MSLLARLGAAVVRPRHALALAGERGSSGRAGSDLMLAMLAVVVATQLRGLIAAAWLGSAVAVPLGLSGAVHVLTSTLTITLLALVAAAVIVWSASGVRDLGRAFDFASVAVLPILLVDLAASTVVDALRIAVPVHVRAVLSGVAYVWALGLVVLAAIEARRTTSAPVPSVPAARIAGRALAVLAAAGVAVQGVWIGLHLERLRPMRQGDPAPAFSLSTVGPRGELGPELSLAQLHGKVVVLDFWAHWCQPCVKGMAHLQRLQAAHPEIAVIAIHLDDPADGRALFTEKGYTLTLLAGTQDVRDRYGVGTIPHTVVIDRIGVVRSVLRGSGDVQHAVAPLL